MFFLLTISFLAGILTVLTPCVLPLLPVILGGSITEKKKTRPLIIIISLIVSIFIFTIILKVSTTFISSSTSTWTILSGLILVLLGIFTLFPELWSRISVRTGLEGHSQRLLNTFGRDNNIIALVITGFVLGPIFTSCSPTYGYIISVVIPRSFFEGLLNLFAYLFGLALILILISIIGQSLISRLKWAYNPKGTFRKVIGVIFIIIGIFIIFGIDKQIESDLLEQPFFQQFSKLDQKLLEKVIL